ncbi:CorA-like Mg2+ transporter protein [compost metagenome]
MAIPLVIITGVYGMNFGEHPWIPMWPFHLFSAVLLLMTPVMFYLFKKSKWL